MEPGISILSSLKPQYFWDVDFSGLSEDLSGRLIIERVFSLGDMHEINLVIRHYGEPRVLEVLSALAYIDPKTFNFIVKLFNKPVSSFKCHRQQRSKPKHWS